MLSVYYNICLTQEGGFLPSKPFLKVPKGKLMILFSLGLYVSSFHCKKNSLQLLHRCLSSKLVLVCFTKIRSSTGTHDLYPKGSKYLSLALNNMISFRWKNLDTLLCHVNDYRWLLSSNFVLSDSVILRCTSGETKVDQTESASIPVYIILKSLIVCCLSWH